MKANYTDFDEFYFTKTEACLLYLKHLAGNLLALGLIYLITTNLT